MNETLSTPGERDDGQPAEGTRCDPWEWLVQRMMALGPLGCADLPEDLSQDATVMLYAAACLGALDAY